MPTIVEFPMDQALNFPPHCASCGREPTSTWKCQRTQGIDLIFIASWKWINATVPVCGRCKLRREILGILAAAALIGVSLAAAIFLMMTVREGGETKGLRLGGALTILFAMVWYVRNRHSGFMDRLLLGVQVLRFDSRRNAATLWIRDERFAPLFNAAAYPAEPMSAASHVNLTGTADSNPYRAPEEVSFPKAPVAKPPAVALTRTHAALMIVGGGGLLLMNHFIFMTDGKYYPVILIAGPPCLTLGIVGLWQPSLIRAAELRSASWPMRIITLTAFALGIGISLYLFTAVYR